jgi:Co/Zn/Cd efflux system component
MDPVMGIVGAIVIIRWSFNLIKGSSDVLLDKSVNPEALSLISDEIIGKHNTIIYDLHVWNVAASHQAAIISISSKNPLSIEEYKRILKQYLPLLSHVTVEILPVQT